MDRLLEREGELEILAQAAGDAIGGRGSLVLVGGEAGIGKTSLLRALRAELGHRVAFLVGGCEPLSVPIPLAPLRELAEVAGVCEPAEAELSDRLLLARNLLESMSRLGPTVAVVEDAHWADPASLDVLRLLTRRVEGQRTALVVTYRDDEVAANPQLAQLLGDLATNPSTRHLVLRPLSPVAIRQLAEPAGVDPARLTRVTGGNPFLIVEAIAAGEQFPPSVRHAALARAGRLSPRGRSVVDAAAVIGQRVEPAVLEEIVPDSGPAIEEALARGVLVASGSVLGFRHELLREAIEDSISPPRRLELHGRVVTALAQRPHSADAARLAHHAELAGLADDACRYAVIAATEAERMGALRETSLQAERALRLGDDLSSGERFELLIQHSRTANFASPRLDEAVSSAQAAVALAVAIGDPVRQGRALVVLAHGLWSLDRVLEARSAAQQAVAVLERTDDVPALARAHSTRVRMEATVLDPGVAVSDAPRALELAERAGLVEIEIDVKISLGLARGHRGDAASLPLLAEALRRARDAGLAIQTVRSYVNLVFVGAILRRGVFVDETAREALAIFDAYQTTIPGFAVEVFRARSLLDRGRWSDALAVVDQPDRDWVSETPIANAIRGLVAARRGESDSAQLLDDVRRELEQTPESSRHGTARVARVEAAWIRGDRVAARGEIQAAGESPATTRFARTGAELALWASRLGLALDLPDGTPVPIQHELEGDWRRAIQAWNEAEAPYEAALAAVRGDDRAARDALRSLHRLGASAASRAFARERAASGARTPRGPRRSTLANAAGLTRREQQVLDELATGATNHTIADALHLSERTVAHHVSAILGKLGAINRVSAIEAARARGLLSQDRQDERQT